MPIYIASVAAIAREIRKSDQNAIDRADNERADEHQEEADGDHRRRLVFVDEERGDDDEESRERPDRKINAGHQKRDCLPKRDEAQRRRQPEDVGDIEGRQEIAFWLKM